MGLCRLHRPLRPSQRANGSPAYVVWACAKAIGAARRVSPNDRACQAAKVNKRGPEDKLLNTVDVGDVGEVGGGG